MFERQLIYGACQAKRRLCTEDGVSVCSGEGESDDKLVSPMLHTTYLNRCGNRSAGEVAPQEAAQVLLRECSRNHPVLMCCGLRIVLEIVTSYRSNVFTAIWIRWFHSRDYKSVFKQRRCGLTT